MKACTELQELRLGMAIHSQIILNGVNPSNSLQFSANLVLNEQASKALDLFNFMLMARIQRTIHGPSYYNCPFAASTLICAYCEILAIDLARKIFDRLSDKNVEAVEKSPLILSNALIAMYTRCDGIEISRKIFDGMVERDLVSWNTMVSASVQNGFDLEGLKPVREMLRLGFHPYSITVTALTSASSNLRDSRRGKQTHAYILRNGVEP
ncbi:pentatricopeptide repeat-containing protein At5g15300-like [Amborella trichopoda]|uniref:pentatricopeptide repeat-containing protein At5g15300-like n=1 Tax=Amborella trichopoda TaxID=13333 RepID=UPI0005D2E808|nr:pentatricopeptide repeat-containing protein At5g15300-like [Amborella trichopoda]|eukprot:XP_011624223.1 pentatricopeptide repeat-containing protein At5g15300-like [Amborella trichopoda]